MDRLFPGQFQKAYSNGNRDNIDNTDNTVQLS